MHDNDIFCMPYKPVKAARATCSKHMAHTKYPENHVLEFSHCIEEILKIAVVSVFHNATTTYILTRGNLLY